MDGFRTTARAALRILLLVAFLAPVGLSMTACDDDDGPAEEAGEKLDESIEKAGDKIEKATD